MKKRKKNAKVERAGVVALENACIPLDLIWRSLLEEDVGVDGTIEVAIGEFPTGKLIGAQVKSGLSYIRSETDIDFRFYADEDDIEYWQALSIPLYIFVHDPRDGAVYWKDFSSDVRGDMHLGPSTVIEMSKANKVDGAFSAHLRARFDLEVFDETRYRVIQTELAAIVWSDGTGGSRVTVTGLDLFIQGLWGLCSKLQFHSSIISDLIRAKAIKQVAEVDVNFTFSREDLYPFLSSYFNILSKNRIAELPANDINHSMFAKMEFPTFVAPLTTNGRKFVEYLRDAVGEEARDNQFFTLSLMPHVQIEVYADAVITESQIAFGPFTDVYAISFNAYLDYYQLVHVNRKTAANAPAVVTNQTIFLHELKNYLQSRFEGVPKDNFLLRYMDVPLSPVICWLEGITGQAGVFPASQLEGKSNARQAGFHDELVSIMAPVGVMTVSEPKMPAFPTPVLANGEILPASVQEASRRL